MRNAQYQICHAQYAATARGGRTEHDRQTDGRYNAVMIFHTLGNRAQLDANLNAQHWVSRATCAIRLPLS
eukprot:1706503-Pyramimonas_sp.AAC.1